MRYHLTPVRWLKLTSQETTDVGKDVVEKRELSYTVGMQTGAAALENSMVPQKVKNKTTL